MPTVKGSWKVTLSALARLHSFPLQIARVAYRRTEAFCQQPRWATHAKLIWSVNLLIQIPYVVMEYVNVRLPTARPAVPRTLAVTVVLFK
jgi:hypothetical protein